jgi:hypothetical protein
MPHTSNSEDRYGLSSVPVLARGLPHPLDFCCFGVLAGSLFSFPTHKQGADTPRCIVFSGPAPRLIVPSVTSPRQECDLLLRKSRPWSEVKSCRGASKRVNTEGFACPNQQYPYSWITYDHIHALVGDGTHGRAEQIQTFRCQACHTTFTARRHTPCTLENPFSRDSNGADGIRRKAGPFRR